MTKGIRVEVFVENASGFVLYCSEQQLTKKKVREYVLGSLEDDLLSGSVDKDAYAAVTKNNFTFRTTPLPDEDPREAKREKTDPPQ